MKRMLLSACFAFSLFPMCDRNAPGASGDAATTTAATAKEKLILPVFAEDKKPTIVVFAVSNRENSEQYPVTLAIWKDGTTIWSSRKAQGGAPYLRAKLQPSQVSGAIKSLSETGLLSDPINTHTFAIPDAAQAHIVVLDEGKCLLNLSVPLRDAGQEEGETSGSTDDLEAYNRRLVTHWKRVQQNLLKLLPETGEPIQDAVFKPVVVECSK